MWMELVGLAVLLGAAGGCGGGQAPSADPQIALGAAHYQGTCSVCHGRDAAGLRGLGSPLVGSAFMSQQSDAEVVAFIARGRGRQDPGNTTGLPMPPRGGNLRLTDEDLGAIVLYLRHADGRLVELAER
jgi:mono/diheme cytochrome c family protein